METQEVMQGERKYKAYVSPDEQKGAYIIIGPVEGLVDALGLPEPFATRLHNILYERGILKYEDARKPHVLIGALQEAYNVDAQLILEKFSEFEKETV